NLVVPWGLLPVSFALTVPGPSVLNVKVRAFPAESSQASILNPVNEIVASPALAGTPGVGLGVAALAEGDSLSPGVGVAAVSDGAPGALPGGRPPRAVGGRAG